MVIGWFKHDDVATCDWSSACQHGSECGDRGVLIYTLLTFVSGKLCGVDRGQPHLKVLQVSPWEKIFKKLSEADSVRCLIKYLAVQENKYFGYKMSYIFISDAPGAITTVLQRVKTICEHFLTSVVNIS